MIIVADSGSTKCDWILVRPNGKRELISTIGFNPYFIDTEGITAELNKEFIQQVPETKIQKVFFYGAGVHNAERAAIVSESLKGFFKNATKIEILHDLLGAARATCLTEAGITCILGTGSNTCLYDGEKIVDNVTNLGFMLGDEGSGSWLGRQLLRGYFYREFPQNLKEKFEAEFGTNGGKVDRNEIMNTIYDNDKPNTYLATFAKFMAENKEELYIQKIVIAAFEELVARHVLKYKDHTELPIHFVGSIAYHFQDLLQLVLAEHNLKLGVIIRKPVERMVDYHVKTENFLEA
jgi:N-acetylglucosamine kinase-like BadF-type ATPase